MAKSPCPPADASKLQRLQLGLVRMQQAAAVSGQRVVVVLEGRDGAGKDGTIKRITEHLSLRATRVVALPKPNNEEQSQWWFQRYVEHLPSAGEVVLFNRSWYNRAGVERVMGFSSKAEQAQFLRDAPGFEAMLVESGIILLKYWLDISKDEQAVRLQDRRDDPLKALKTSALDEVAQAKWRDYSEARDDMLLATHTVLAPWWCVRADDKKPARRAVIRHMLDETLPEKALKGLQLDPLDPEVIFPFEPKAIGDGRLAH